MFKKIGIGLALLGGFAFGLFLRFYRPWHSRWGATDDEVMLAIPADELIYIVALNKLSLFLSEFEKESVLRKEFFRVTHAFCKHNKTIQESC